MDAIAKRLYIGTVKLAKRYEELIVRDPDLARRLESGIRLASYLIPGRMGGSWAVTETAYSLANLYCLLNDYIVTRKCPSASPLSKVPSQQRVLMWFLAVLECIEVMLEMTSELVMREPGKWAVVIVIQCMKAMMRGVLVFYMRSGLLTSPTVPSPDRKQAKLQHHVTPSLLSSSSQSPRSATLSTKQLAAEALYITRPLIHLASMFTFSEHSWKPWLFSLAMDLISLQLHGGLLRWQAKEKSEIVRRRVSLLLYLMRTPFYNHYTKAMVFKILQFLSATIPLVKMIVDPVLAYIPIWQNTYCYNWGS